MAVPDTPALVRRVSGRSIVHRGMDIVVTCWLLAVRHGMHYLYGSISEHMIVAGGAVLG
jgi:hypothetical protein